MKAVFIGSNSEIAEMAWLSIRLGWPHAKTQVAVTAGGGLELVKETSPDVVLLHPSFIDLSLTEAIQELRRFTNVPLVVLSYRCDEEELMNALELGADDYVALPCDLTEMMARIWALLRRVGFATQQMRERALTCGDLLISPATHQVFLGDHRVPLTLAEFRLLYFLVQKQGEEVPLQLMGCALPGVQSNNSGTVNGDVQGLRSKLRDVLQDINVG